MERQQSLKTILGFISFLSCYITVFPVSFNVLETAGSQWRILRSHHESSPVRHLSPLELHRGTRSRTHSSGRSHIHMQLGHRSGLRSLLGSGNMN